MNTERCPCGQRTTPDPSCTGCDTWSQNNDSSDDDDYENIWFQNDDEEGDDEESW